MNYLIFLVFDPFYTFMLLVFLIFFLCTSKYFIIYIILLFFIFLCFFVFLCNLFFFVTIAFILNIIANSSLYSFYPFFLTSLAYLQTNLNLNNYQILYFVCFFCPSSPFSLNLIPAMTESHLYIFITKTCLFLLLYFSLVSLESFVLHHCLRLLYFDLFNVYLVIKSLI